jgi:DNA-binding transcriptional ArsR family regulator
MPKITLDMDTFKALASETRVDILKTLDGKMMSLKDIGKIVNLNKATLHVHLAKLHEAGLVKRKERKGHKWVYFKLSWKGECLLHPENSKIIFMFTATFLSLFFGIVSLVNFVKGRIITSKPTNLFIELLDRGASNEALSNLTIKPHTLNIKWGGANESLFKLTS